MKQSIIGLKMFAPGVAAAVLVGIVAFALITNIADTQSQEIGCHGDTCIVLYAWDSYGHEFIDAGEGIKLGRPLEDLDVQTRNVCKIYLDSVEGDYRFDFVASFKIRSSICAIGSNGVQTTYYDGGVVPIDLLNIVLRVRYRESSRGNRATPTLAPSGLRVWWGKPKKEISIKIRKFF